MKRSIFSVCRQAFAEWNADEAPNLGAALAFYCILAMGPLLLTVISVSGLLIGHAAAASAIIGQMSELVGAQGTKVIEDVLGHLRNQDRNLLAAAIGIATLLISVSGFFVHLQGALNTIFNVPKQKGSFGQFLSRRLLSFGMIAGICLMLLVSLAVSAWLAAVTDMIGDAGPAVLVQVVNIFLSLIVATALFAVTFKVVPDIFIDWKDVWIGGFFTAALFTAGKSVISIYLGQSAFSSEYGAAGSLIVLLVWIYYSSQIVFLGAEFTQAWTQMRGRGSTPKIAVPSGSPEPTATLPAPGGMAGIVLKTVTLATVVGLHVFINHMKAGSDRMRPRV